MCDTFKRLREMFCPDPWTDSRLLELVCQFVESKYMGDELTEFLERFEDKESDELMKGR